PFKQQVLHVDFQRVDAAQSLTTKVPLHFVNADTSPAVKIGGAIISHVLTELEVTCLPADLPQFIEVDLGSIEAGGIVHFEDITLPKGVAYAGHGIDPNPVIASAIVKAGGGEAAADDAAEAAE